MTDEVGRGIHVLLVDDEPDVAEVTALHLEREREAIETDVSTEPERAIECLADVDCVVSDYDMPVTDGLALLREVRDRRPDLPFILYTGKGSEEIASEAVSAGVTDYLQKETGTDQYTVLANRIENAVARRRSELEAAATQERYRRLVESSPNAILVHDGEELLYVNDRVVEIVGADDAESLLGRSPTAFIHPEDEALVRKRVNRLFAEGAVEDWVQFRIEAFTGEVRHVESRAATVEYEGVRASQVVLRDVTDRRRRERRLRTLHEATRRLQTAGDESAVASIVVDTIRDTFEESLVVVWRHDPDAAVLRVLDSTDEAQAIAEREVGEPEPPLPADSVEMGIFQTGEPRVVADYPETAGSVTDSIATTFLVPLAEYGMLGIAGTEHRDFERWERELVGVLAESAVAALDRVADADD